MKPVPAPLLAPLVVLILGLVPPAARGAPGDTLSMRAAVATGLSQNAAVRIASAERRAANARAWASVGGVLPEVTATSEYERNLEVNEAFLPETLFDPDGDPQVLVPVRFGADNAWRAQVSLSFPILDVGGWLRVAAGQAGRSLAAARTDDALRRAREEIRLAFLDLLLADERAAILRRGADRVTTTLAEATSRLESGLASPYELQQLETAAMSAGGEYRRSRLAVSSAGRRLAIAMGRDPAASIRVEGTLRPDLPEIEGAVSAALSVAMEPARAARGASAAPWRQVDRRPDVVEAARRVAVQRNLHRAAQADRIPRAVLFGTAGVTAQQNGSPRFFGESPRQRSTTLVAGVRVELPLFDAGRLARVTEAASDLAANEIALDLRRREALAEIIDLESELRDAVASLNESFASRRTAGRGRAIAAAAASTGGGSRLQLMDADLRLATADFDYARAVHRVLTAAVRLEAAGGPSFDVDGVLDAWNRAD